MLPTRQMSPRVPAFPRRFEMYSLETHGSMMADRVRLTAYGEALRRAVRPGAVVADIGCGGGIFSLMACRAGARRVFAMETDPIIAVAREAAAAHGFSDRIVFLAGNSAHVELPERADVLVFDVRGILPHFGRSMATIMDARKRFLVPAGAIIPQQDTVWAALSGASSFYRDLISPWSGDTCGFDMSAARHAILNSIHRGCFQQTQIVGVPQRCWVLDYTTLDNPNAAAEVTFEIERPATAYGCFLWFDALLREGVGYTTAPGAPETVYGTAFFPWLEPVGLAPGERVCAAFHADPVGSSYVWRWNTTVYAAGRSPQPRIQFRQSTFFGELLSPGLLNRLSPACVPELNEEAAVDRFLLERMDGRISLEEAARACAVRFPEGFAGWEEAFEYASRLAGKYSR